VVLTLAVAVLAQRTDHAFHILDERLVYCDQIGVAIPQHRAPEASLAGERKEYRAPTHERLVVGADAGWQSSQDVRLQLTLAPGRLEHGAGEGGFVHSRLLSPPATRRKAGRREGISSRFIIFCSPKRERPSSSAARVWLPPVLSSATC